MVCIFLSQLMRYTEILRLVIDFFFFIHSYITIVFQYYPNPENFDPERFAPENKHKIIPFTYLPFGMGPHRCIGERFGILESKLGFIHFLKNYSVMPCDKTPVQLTFKPKSLLLQAKNGVYLNIVRDPML